MKIFLDVDEVLADFVGSVCKLYGLDREELERRYPPNCWGIHVPLETSEEDMWNRIHELGISFWSDLPLTPWAQDIVHLVSDYDPQFRLITSPANSVHCSEGKKIWIEKQFGAEFTAYHIDSNKGRYALPESVLIDDGEHNIKSFVKAGGGAIVFPAYHNSLHEHRKNPVDYVYKTLKRIVGA